MEQPMERYVQAGLIAAMAYPEEYHKAPVSVVRRIARDPWFSAVELNPIADSSARKACRELLESAHMTVCYSAHNRLLSTGLNPNDLEETGRCAAQQALLEEMEEARELGATGFAFLAGHWEQDKRRQGLEQLKKTTIAVCRYAAQFGMQVELEIFDFDIAKAALIGPAPLAEEFAAGVRSCCSNFGLMVDLSHIPMCYEEPAFVFRALRPYITHMHIGNTIIRSGYDAYGDEHPRFGFPHSENDVTQLVKFFRSARNEQCFDEQRPIIMSIEIKPRPNEDANAVLANSKRVVERAWALA